MGRRLTGSVLQYGEKWRAFVGREYLGTCDAEQEGWDLVNAWLAIEGDTAPDTLRRFAAGWFDARELDGHVRHVRDERSVWRSRVEFAAFIDWPMRRIKPRDVQTWLRALQKREARYTLQTVDGPQGHGTGRKLSRQSVAHARRVLKSVLDDAVIAGKLQSNPVIAVRVPKQSDEARDGELIVFATQAEITALLALDLPACERAVFSVAIYAGLRAGEIWGLRWEDVALDSDPLLRVRRSYDGPPKTKWSLRDVPLLEPARAALKAWKHHGGIIRARGLVFPADDPTRGERKHSRRAKKRPPGGCHSSGYDSQWADHRERVLGDDGELALSSRPGWRTKAGIREEITLHCLRHTTACHLLQGTWAPKLLPRALSLLELKHWLGHSSIAVTEKHYARLAPGNLLDAVRFDRPNFDRKAETSDGE